MPVHKIPRATLHEDLTSLEREGESVVSITPVGRHFVVVTRFHTPNEFRPAQRLDKITHAARVGAQEQRVVWDRDPLLHSFVTDKVVVDE